MKGAYGSGKRRYTAQIGRRSFLKEIYKQMTGSNFGNTGHQRREGK